MSDSMQAMDVSREDLDKVIKHHMIAAFGAGLMPLPMVDFVAVSGVQLNLVRKLAKAYGTSFSRNVVQTIISSLAGSTVPAVVESSLGSLVKAIPVVGVPLGTISMPVTAAAMTYAIGNVFISHFESDGTLLSFDLDTARGYFMELFKKGEEMATHLTEDILKGDEETTAASASKEPEEKSAKKTAAKKTAAKKTAMKATPAQRAKGSVRSKRSPKK